MWAHSGPYNKNVRDFVAWRIWPQAFVVEAPIFTLYLAQTNLMKGKKMQIHKNSDPVSLVIKACHKNEDEAKRIYHLLAEERQHQITLDSETTIHLSEEQLGEFAERYSAEVEPEYWQSKRLKH